jgi:hypothetical protein
MAGQFRDNGGTDPTGNITRANTKVPYPVLEVTGASQERVRAGYPGSSTNHATRAGAKVPYPSRGRGQACYPGLNGCQVTRSEVVVAYSVIDSGLMGQRVSSVPRGQKSIRAQVVP